MNILRFINSKDIREHLKKLDYQFNSLETAWLIYQCREATIEEKHKAWEELIGTMPDCEITKRFNTAPQPSLHDFLRKFMELEDRFITQFLEDNHGDTYADDKPYVYQFEFLYPDGSKMEWHTPFSKVSEYKNLLDPQEPVKTIQCRKYRINRVDYMMDYALFTPELKFLRIEPIRIKDKKENEIFNDVFEGLWFEFPTPFKKGDIVWNPDMPSSENLCAGPLVLTGVCLEDITRENTRENIRRNGDITDMRYAGYFFSEDSDIFGGGIYGEGAWTYMDLEYYEKELTGAARVLTALSAYLKGEIDEGLYARAYHQILMEEYAKRCMPRDYWSEGLRLAGLEPDRS